MRRRVALATLLVGALLAGGCADATAPAGPEPVTLALSLQAADGISSTEGAALGAAFDRVDRFKVRVEDAASRALYADTVIRVTPGASAHELAIDLPESALGATLTVTLTALAGEVEMFTASTRAVAARPGRDATAATVEVGVRYVGPGIRGSVVGNDGRGASGVTLQVLRDGQAVATATTASDGTYLVLDLPAGTYTVRLAPRAGLTGCPGERRVTLGAESDAAVAAFQYRAGSCVVRVLVLSGGDVDGTAAAAALLTGVTDVEVETFFFVARTPGIEALRAFDAVLLFQDGLFGESAVLGAELAQYVALGGNVVFGAFYWQGRSDGGKASPGWGPLEGMDPFASTGGATYTPAKLGTATPHPLTDGVASLASSGFRGGVSAKAGTTVVATWDDGVPLLGFREGNAGQRLVGVSLFPAHQAVGGVSGDFARVWRNAVTWAGQAGGPARTGPVGGAR